MSGLRIDLKAAMGYGKNALAVSMAINAAKKGYTLFVTAKDMLNEFPEYINVQQLPVDNLVELADTVNDRSFVILNPDYLMDRKDSDSVIGFEPLLTALLSRNAVVLVLSNSSTGLELECNNPRARQFLLLGLLGVHLNIEPSIAKPHCD